MIKLPFVKFQIRFWLIGHLVLLLVIVAFSLSLFKNITRVRRADQQLSQAQETLVNLKNEQQSLEKELQSIRSEPFLEKQARDKLGLAREGEIVLVLPEDDLLRSFSPRNNRQESDTLPDPHWRQWAKLFNLRI